MMKTRQILFMAISFLIMFSMTCSENVIGPGDGDLELPAELTAAEGQLVESSHSFSFNVFESIVAYDDTTENIFISPLSISIALGMTMNGARGETFDQMRETLVFNGLEMEQINEGYQFLAERLKTADPHVKFQIANSVWSKEGFPVEDQFLEDLRTYFNAQATELDFDDPDAPDVINKWVEENTNGLIEKIIDGIPPHMVMYLINAIYFKGDWTHPFDEERTSERTFYLENGDETTIDMMNQDRAFNTYFSDQVRMIDLPYSDSLFSMTLLMPGDAERPLDDFIRDDFTYADFSNWVGNLSYERTILSLPKFELEYDLKLNDVLIAMGMDIPFDGSRADFKGINPNGRLFISEVKHKTFVSVDEKGTEAAAVTSVGIGVTSAPPSFIVNRPFIFLIRERQTGAIIFMGKIKNPAS